MREELTIRDKIRRIRVTGMSIDDVAVFVGSSTRSVRRWALGQSNPAKRFKTKIDALYRKRLELYKQR